LSRPEPGTRSIESEEGTMPNDHAQASRMTSNTRACARRAWARRGPRRSRIRRELRRRAARSRASCVGRHQQL